MTHKHWQLFVMAFLMVVFIPIYYIGIAHGMTRFGLDFIMIGFIFISMGLLYLWYHSHLKSRWQRLQNKARLNSHFYQLLKSTTQREDTKHLYKMILQAVLNCMSSAKKGSILLVDRPTGLLHFAATIGYDESVLEATYLELEQTYLYKESEGQIAKTVKIRNPLEYDRQNFEGENIVKVYSAGLDDVKTTLSTPIFIDKQLYGMINIDSPIDNDFSKDDEEVLELFALELKHVITLHESTLKNDYLMNYDVLTGIPNRRYIKSLAEDCYKKQEKNNGCFSMAVIDLDNLKPVNDTYGHDAGDALLQAFCAFIKKEVTIPYDFGRHGGDEFVLILPDVSYQEAKIMLQKIQKDIKKEPIIYDSKTLDLHMNFSFGIASYSEDSRDLETLLKMADERMYEQKNAFKHMH